MLDISISHQALQWRADGHAVAVAVVLATWGSAPRPVGARLFVRDDGEFAGSVSGGCIEGEVITAAAEVLNDRQTQSLTFGVADEAAWEVGLSCGGQIALLVYPLTAGAAGCLATALRHIERRGRAVLFTRSKDGAQCLQNAQNVLLSGDGAVAAGLAAADYLNPAHPPVQQNGVFIEALTPRPRLLLIGATHITQFILPLAHQLDFECVIIDPRQRWATPARFPGADLRCAWPEDALAELGISHQDAVVTLTHDPKIDDPALLGALSAQPFYIGALGSRRTHEKRLARLQEAGVGLEQAAQIHAPVGLDLGAKTAAEIALSVMAQVLQAYRRPAAAP